jgi:hypothetical protein
LLQSNDGVLSEPPYRLCEVSVHSNGLGSSNSPWLQLDIGSSNERSPCFRQEISQTPCRSLESLRPHAGRLRSRLPRPHAQGPAAWSANAARSAPTSGFSTPARDDAHHALIAGPLSHRRVLIRRTAAQEEHSGLCVGNTRPCDSCKKIGLTLGWIALPPTCLALPEATHSAGIVVLANQPRVRTARALATRTMRRQTPAFQHHFVFRVAPC